MTHRHLAIIQCMTRFGDPSGGPEIQNSETVEFLAPLRWCTFLKRPYVIWKLSRNKGGDLKHIFKYHFGLKTTLKSPMLDLNPEFGTSPPP